MSTETKNILVFKHMASQNPGIFHSFAKEHDVVFDEIDLYENDSIPELKNYRGLWVMGGSMNVWEEGKFPWLIEEKKAIRHGVEELDMPFLGICLGHQLLAEAFGGKAGPTNQYEIGIFQITPTKAGLNHPFLANLPTIPGWTNAHLAEIKQTPANAKILATSENCDNHAMSIGEKAFSVQFHPEMCETTLADWLDIPGIVPVLTEKLGKDGFEKFKKDIEENRPALNIGAKQLFENWLSLVY